MDFLYKQFGQVIETEVACALYKDYLIMKVVKLGTLNELINRREEYLLSNVLKLITIG